MYTTRVQQHVDAPRAAVFRALLDGDAVARWRVPEGMTARVHEFEGREGGRFRISLTYDHADGTGKSGSHTDTYHGRFTRVVPDELVVETMEFESRDADLTVTMTMTTTLVDEGDGTLVVLVHEGVPDAVRPEDNETGMRMALSNLAQLVAKG